MAHSNQEYQHSSPKESELKDAIDAAKAKLSDLAIKIKPTLATDPYSVSKHVQVHHLLEDIKKLNQLKRVYIPELAENGPSYYQLAESVGGATEKISLIDEQTLMDNLKQLGSTAIDETNYKTVRDKLKLRTNAMIKLPKYGNIKEVQRESMALAFSRILGLETTQSTDVCYEGKPALFIPFENIVPLNQFASGKTMNAAFSSKTYKHYSTLNSVGEGLQSNTVISDLGQAIGLFYLCSDTDAMGGYNQNKALKGNELFVFDQVFFTQDKLGIDSRLSLQPTKWFTKHTRHDQGRNRTLIEDASIEVKYNALMQLKDNKDPLVKHCDDVILKHCIQLKNQKKQKPQIKAEIDQTRALLNDAIKVKKKLIERIDAIDKVFPRVDSKLYSQNSQTNWIVPTLSLEKLVNKPRLFTDSARAYRTSWTQRNPIHCTSVKEDKDSDFVIVKFNKVISTELLEALREKTGKPDSPKRTWFRNIRIRKSDLLAINENILFPEQNPLENFNEQKFLDSKQLQALKGHYEAGHKTKVIDSIAMYESFMSKIKPEFLSSMIDATRQDLARLRDSAEDKGFAQHVLKKFEFDVQQKLQRMIPQESMPADLKAAFEASIKLDQVSQFNKVIACAIKHDNLIDPVVSKFLIGCIEKSKDLEQHTVAVSNSQSFQQDALDTISSIDSRTLQKQSRADIKAALAEVKSDGDSQNKDVNSIDDTHVEKHTNTIRLP